MSWQTLAPTLYGSETNVSQGGVGTMSTDGTTLVSTSLSGDFINISSFDLNLKYYNLINSSWTVKASVNISFSMPLSCSISEDGTKIALQYLKLNEQTKTYINIYLFNNSQLNLLSTVSYDGVYVPMDMSKDGSILVIGNSSANNNSGLVDVYSLSSTPSKIATLNGQSNEGFGNQVSISNDASTIAVVSKYSSSYNESDQSVKGRITLFTRNTNVISLFQTITTTENNYFNTIRIKISSNGQMLVVGLPTYDNSKGRIETYFKSGNIYTKSVTTIDGTEPYDSFGDVVALSGDDQILCILNDAVIDSSNTPTSFIFYRLNGTSWINEQVTIGNLNVHPKSGPLFINLNQSGTTFVYSYPEYIPQGWTNTNIAAGAVYTLTRNPVQNNTGNVPCFPAGTKVQTPSGSVPVEQLTSKHQILTADGRAVPFKLYRTEINKTTQNTAPYIIPAHTFAHNSPAATLTLSPLHAFQLSTGLWHIPKYAAKQYSAITQPTIGTAVTYYHIELPNYFTDNIIAEGTVVESFGANQTKGVKNVYKYNSTLQCFTRISQPLQSKRALLK